MAQRTEANIPSFGQTFDAAQNPVRPDLQPAVQNFLAQQQLTNAKTSQDLLGRLQQARLNMDQLKLDPEIAQLKAQTGLIAAQTDAAGRKSPTLPSSGLTGYVTPEQLRGLPVELPVETFNTLAREAGDTARARTAAEKDKKKAVPSAEVAKVGQIRSLLNQLNPAEKAYKASLVDGDSPFVGPKDARVQSAKQFLPGQASTPFATFKANLYGVRNQLLNMLSGAAISPAEYERLLNALPNENANEKDFEAKFASFKVVQNDIINEKLTAFRQAGYDTAGLEGGQAAGSVQGGAEERYNELLQSGMPEDQVYSKLAEEGF